MSFPKPDKPCALKKRNLVMRSPAWVGAPSPPLAIAARIKALAYSGIQTPFKPDTTNKEARAAKHPPKQQTVKYTATAHQLEACFAFALSSPRYRFPPHRPPCPNLGSPSGWRERWRCAASAPPIAAPPSRRPRCRTRLGKRSRSRGRLLSGRPLPPVEVGCG